MHRVTLALTVLLPTLTLSACGISGNLRHNPGFADFKSPGLRTTNREFALSLGPLPLRLARWFLDDDPETAAILKGLDAVRVYIYEIDGDSERVKQRMTSTLSHLSGEGWQPVVAVREDDGATSVLVRVDRHNRTRGMVVMTHDASEVVLINLIGDLRPEMFNSYMAELDIDAPDIELEAGQAQLR